MNKVHFTKTTIQRVTQQKLEYIDDAGRSQQIDFETCRNNDVERTNTRNKDRRPGHLFIDSPQTWKYVATRNVMGEPPWELDLYKNEPYIEFYTQPPTRFVFAASEEGHDDYCLLRSLIEQVGWLTFDAS
jgi:hypothetical protein